MNEDTLTKTQKELLKMFSWFHNFCVAHNLRYYCLGGTMLGAVRHQGFIPWDDDIDVGLPREDYEKLLELLGGKISDGFYLESYKQGKKDFIYSYAKFYDTTTTLIENTRYKTKRGLYIDVFPLDGIGNTEKEAKINYQKIVPLLNLLSVKSCGIRKGRKWYKNLSIILARIIPDCILSEKNLIKKINHICMQQSFDKCNYICNADGNWREKEIIKRDVFGEPKLYEFNGLKVYGVYDYDSYLTHMYGKWRNFPPVDKRVTHHDYLYIDLNTPYL